MPKYTFREVCVTCNGYVCYWDKVHNSGICPCCGVQNPDDKVRTTREIGYWINVPLKGWWNKICGNTRSVWIPKEEDAQIHTSK